MTTSNRSDEMEFRDDQTSDGPSSFVIGQSKMSTFFGNAVRISHNTLHRSSKSSFGFPKCLSFLTWSPFEQTEKLFQFNIDHLWLFFLRSWPLRLHLHGKTRRDFLPVREGHVFGCWQTLDEIATASEQKTLFLSFFFSQWWTSRRHCGFWLHP